MSQKPNYRREEERHQDNGPIWEGGPPNSGSNSTHVARSRKKWKRYRARAERRVGLAKKFHGPRRHTAWAGSKPEVVENELEPLETIEEFPEPIG